jgi:hypothetical protein
MQFRRFEPAIKLAIEKFPEPVVLHVDGLAPSTILARCRDAIQSVQTFNWHTEWTIDTATLKRLKVFQQGNGLYIGGTIPREGLTPATPSLPKPPEHTLQLTYRTLHALAVLISASTWPGVSFTFRWTDSENEFNPSRLKILEAFDVAIIPHPDFENTHVIL